MNQSLADYLNENKVDTDTIQQAVRYYIAEITDDLSLDKILEQIIKSTGQKEKVNAILSKIEGNTSAVEEAALSLLSSAWQYPDEAERIRTIIDEAKKKMPVIDSYEMAIFTLAAIGIVTGGLVFSYHEYLQATEGVKTTTIHSIRKPDGTIESVEEKTYEGFSEPLREATNLFREGAKVIDKNTPKLPTQNE